MVIVNYGETRIPRFQEYVHEKHGLETTTETGIEVYPFIRMQKLELAIIMGKDTTVQAVRDSWWQICQWRDALREWEPEIVDPLSPYLGEELRPQPFYAGLDRLSERLSYAEIARRLNRGIEILLLRHSSSISSLHFGFRILQREYPDASPDSDQYEIAFDRLFRHVPDLSKLRLTFAEDSSEKHLGSVISWQMWSFSYDRADKTLRYCRPSLTDEEREKRLAYALNRIEEKRSPFPENEPIRRSDVIARLRNWREGQKGVEEIG